MPGKKVFIYLFCFVALVACGNNPYPPDSGKMIGYSALGEDPEPWIRRRSRTLHLQRC